MYARQKSVASEYPRFVARSDRGGRLAPRRRLAAGGVTGERGRSHGSRGRWRTRTSTFVRHRVTLQRGCSARQTRRQLAITHAASQLGSSLIACLHKPRSIHSFHASWLDRSLRTVYNVSCLRYVVQNVGNVTSAGWQVILCDPIWHVSSRGGEASR